MTTLTDMYAASCEFARITSLADGCTHHVYAILGASIGCAPCPQIVGFGMSDWSDGATVATFTAGKQA